MSDIQKGVNNTIASPGGDEEVPTREDFDKLKEHKENLEKALKETRGKNRVIREEIESLKKEIEGLKDTKLEKDAFEGLEDDDAVPVAAVKKLLGEQRSREAQRSLARDFQTGYLIAQAKHSDFDEVVTPEAFDELELRMKTDPDFTSQVLQGDKNPLNFAENVYKTLKAKKGAKPKDKDGEEDSSGNKDNLIDEVKGPATMTASSSGVAKTRKEKILALPLAEKERRLAEGSITRSDLDPFAD